MSSRQERFIKTRLCRAVDALDEIDERLGENWDNYEWDGVSSARQALREKLDELARTSLEEVAQ